MSTVTIRLASTADAALVADISRATFYETFAADNTPENMEKFMNDQFSREKLMAELYDPNSIFLLAEIEGEVVGYTRLRESPNPTALGEAPSIEIARIYTISKMIGRGVGSILIEHCIEVARKLGMQIIWLGVWEHNQRAIDFYTKWGFTKFDDHIFALGDDPQTDWLMKKEL
ncbi:GNAT family N-acetyltransferase [Paraflavitalea pollutisoli]|uniref:GNAT family N-acetyltransferase n=1 Tax=Paraflavitalea pollutisoli TaxID=3034143 RepID=UPI0023ECF717|nr:GNAT family N-acetyltransferase [Paraflavitalea sp. H1-2-19X]